MCHTSDGRQKLAVFIYTAKEKYALCTVLDVEENIFQL